MTSTPPPKIREIRQMLPTGVPTIYVEGLSQMLVGFPNSRIMLHSMAERDMNNPEAPENRQIACELIVPTPALIEIAQIILNTMASNKDMMDQARQEWMGKVDALNNSLAPITSPATN